MIPLHQAALLYLLFLQRGFSLGVIYLRTTYLVASLRWQILLIMKHINRFILTTSCDSDYENIFYRSRADWNWEL
jgi:hypothetical protein